MFLYIYTSGTTGYPKPAIIRHLRFTMAGLGLAPLLGVEPRETIYAPLPLYHGESLFVGFAPAFRVGGTFASRRRFAAHAFLDDVRRHEAVALVYVGELCRYLCRQPPTPHDRDHRLRVAAGAGLRPDIWIGFQERFGIARIIEMYGATEGNVALHNADGRVGSVGKPHPLLEDNVRLARFDLTRGALVRPVRGRRGGRAARACRRPRRGGGRLRRLHGPPGDGREARARCLRAGRRVVPDGGPPAP